MDYIHTINVSLHGVPSSGIPAKLQQLLEDIQFFQSLLSKSEPYSHEIFLGTAAYCAVSGIHNNRDITYDFTLTLEKGEGTLVGTMSEIPLRSPIFMLGGARNDEYIPVNSIQYRCWRVK